MKAYILINARIGAINEVVRHLRRIEHVREANTTLGPYDAVAILEAQDARHLGRLLTEAIQPIPGVEETLTCLAVDDSPGE